MSRTKSPCLLISLLLFLLLVATVHGAQLAADAKDTGFAGKRVTLREGVGGGHGHGYSSHQAHNPSGTPVDGSGATTAVDPRMAAVRSHHHRGAASRTLGYPRLATCMLLGATFLVVLV